MRLGFDCVFDVLVLVVEEGCGGVVDFLRKLSLRREFLFVCLGGVGFVFGGGIFFGVGLVVLDC